jgi:O-antigen/teichoic acid export membrane protein
VKAIPIGVDPKISHAVLLTSAQLARGLFRLLFVVVVARQLGPQQFGVYALLLAVVEMLAVASGSGYADYLTREAAKDARVGWGLASQLTWLRFGCALLLAGAGLGILWVLGYPRMVLVAIAWLSVSLAPRSISETVQGVLRGIGRYVAYVVVELVFDLVLVGGAVLLLAQGGGLKVVIATEIIAPTAAAVASVVFALVFRPNERVWLNARQLLEKSIIFNTYAFVSNLYDRFDIVLLSKLAGDYATGVYSAAYRPLGTIQLVPYGVLYSLLPALSRGAPAERERLEKAMGLLLSIAFVVVLATMVYASPAVGLLFGVRYAESAIALKVLIWAVILRYVNYALNIRLLAGGHERVFLATSLICLGVNLIGNLIFIPRYSWRAAAAMTIVTEAALLVQNVFWLRRTVGAVPRPFGWVRSSLVFAALMGVALAGTRTASPGLIGSACILFFLMYLYRTGMIEEFARIWGAGRGLERSNS